MLKERNDTRQGIPFLNLVEVETEKEVELEVTTAMWLWIGTTTIPFFVFFVAFQSKVQRLSVEKLTF